MRTFLNILYYIFLVFVASFVVEVKHMSSQYQVMGLVVVVLFYFVYFLFKVSAVRVRLGSPTLA